MRLYRWDEDFVDRALQGYQQFIKLKLLQEDWDAAILSPSLIVDKVWHEHLLDNKHYNKACMDYCGGEIIGHNPDGGLDPVARKDRIKATKLCLKTLFRGDIDDAIWKFDEDHSDTANINNNKRNKRQRSDDFTNYNSGIGPVVSPDGGDDVLIIRILDDTHEETYFKIKRTSEMRRVFVTYAERKGMECSALRFLLDGERISDPDATPEMLELEDMDLIRCVLEQTGC